MKKRNIVLTLLVFIGVITFLDRINISVASTAIMKDLNISEERWGFILSAFIITYGLLQMPLGLWGDIKGQRGVLSIIVIWWSLFTILTGFANGFYSLILIRFLFGIGEAGAYPCMTGSISRWFPKNESGKAQGFIWAASRMGGAMTPFVVYPIITSLGWRMAFYLLGGLGFIWVAAWYFLYRDKPSEMKGITKEELSIINSNKPVKEKIKVPWKEIYRISQNCLLR